MRINSTKTIPELNTELISDIRVHCDKSKKNILKLSIGNEIQWLPVRYMDTLMLKKEVK